MVKKLACLAAVLLFGTAGQALASSWDATGSLSGLIDHGNGVPVADTSPHIWVDGSKTWDETASITDLAGITWTYGTVNGATAQGFDASMIVRHEFHIVNDTNLTWTDFHITIFDMGTPDATIVNDGFTATIPGSSVVISNPVGGNPSVDFYFSGPTVVPGAAMTAMVSLSNPNQSIYGILLYPTAVPVPASAWLLGSGLVGLAGLRRQRK